MKRILTILLTIKKRTGTTLSTVSYLLLTVLCSLLTIHCSAQLHGQAKIDSLLKDLPKQKEDSNKVNILYRLSKEYKNNENPNDGLKYGLQALETATKIGWKKGIARTSLTIGLCHWRKAEFSKALECFHRCLPLFEALGDDQGIVNSNINIGLINAETNNYAEALEYYDRAIKILKRTGDKASLAIVYSNIGNVHRSKNELPIALSYYHKAIKINQEMGNKIGIAINTGSIGAVYFDEEDYSVALSYYEKAFNMFERLEHKRGIAVFGGNMGTVYQHQKNYPKALEYYFKALKIDEELGDKRSEAITTGNISGIYYHQQNYTQSIAWDYKSLQLAQAIGNREVEAVDYAGLASNFVGIATHPADKSKVSIDLELPEAPFLPDTLIPTGRKALLDKAVTYYREAITISKEIGSLNQLQNFYRELSYADSLRGDYKNALEDYMQHVRFHDSLFSIDNAKKILQQQMKYDFTLKEDSLKLVNAKKEKAAALKYQRQRSYTWMGFVGILALAIFSIFMVRNNKLLGKEKQRSDDLLLNILPEEVATELKNTGITTAKHYDNVTVLFTDFVNFTQASESMGAQNLIDELHTCFKKFDEIAEKYNIEKIKTIGDAYLAVAGLPAADPKHAENIVNAAQDIVAFMDDRLAKMGTERTFQVRVGIHSGSVVAGVVGLKKFAYDIWGDTVNTVARMEQNSEAGKINISQTTYELVKDKFTCKYRGEVDAKGKGMMKMYFVS